MDRQSYREAVAALFKTPSQAESLCQLIQNNHFPPLKDNQVVHNNEEAVLQAFFAAIILPFKFSGATGIPSSRPVPNTPGLAKFVLVSVSYLNSCECSDSVCDVLIWRRKETG